MPQPNNPASRVAAILECALRGGHPDAVPVIDVWAKALEVDFPSDSPHRPAEVARGLALMADQVEAARVLAARRGLRAQNYDAQLTSVRSGLRPNLLWVPWISAKQHFGEGPMLALNTLADILDQDEPPLAHDVLEEIMRVARELEDLTRKSDFTPDVKAFVLSLIDAIRTAVRDYQLLGATALKRAAQLATLALAERPEYARSAPRSVVFRRLHLLVAGLQFAAQIVGEPVIKTGEFLEGVEHIQALEPVAQRVFHIRSAAEAKRLPPGVPRAAVADVTATKG